MRGKRSRRGWHRAASKGYGVPARTIPLRPDGLVITDRRRQVVVAMLRDKMADPRWRELDYEAQLLFTVGGLICDEVGFISEPSLMRACADLRVLLIAEDVLREGGAGVA